MTEAQRQVVRSMLQMARADGKVVPREQELLDRLLRELGATPGEMSALESGCALPHLEDVLPTHEERLDTIRHLMRMSMCDGNISFTEFAYLATMAERLNIDQDELERLRDEVMA